MDLGGADGESSSEDESENELREVWPGCNNQPAQLDPGFEFVGAISAEYDVIVDSGAAVGIAPAVFGESVEESGAFKT